MKKRAHWIIAKGILVAPIGQVAEKTWEELATVATKFGHFRDDFDLALTHHNDKWKKFFLTAMIEISKKTGDWKAIASRAEENSSEWNRAIREVYQDAIDGRDILSRWQGLIRIIPAKHSLKEEAKENSRRIKKNKKRI